eukprot:11203350-Lingulodinium_polyedra.AAC.1
MTGNALAQTPARATRANGGPSRARPCIAMPRLACRWTMATTRNGARTARRARVPAANAGPLPGETAPAVLS